MTEKAPNKTALSELRILNFLINEINLLYPTATQCGKQINFVNLPGIGKIENGLLRSEERTLCIQHFNVTDSTTGI
ncbi:Uncharacterised protein [Escherichia coli]|nr:Uncharacterised protein [Escherichia coli]